MPKRWVPPSEALEKFADLGLPVDAVVKFDQLYFSLVGFVLCLLSALFIAGPLHREVWLNPDNNVAKNSFLGLGLGLNFFSSACFLPSMKILLWPLAAWEQKGLVISAGVSTGCLLLCANLRLARIDTKLNRLRMTWNIFDWSSDRDSHERANETDLTRKQDHVLSLSSPRYDIIMVVLRLMSLLNALFCIRLPDHGVTTASIQLALGVLIFAAGYFCDPYFPPVLGAWDQNRIQNATDASLISIYFAALLATIAADYYSSHILNSLWITFSPLLALPAGLLGYHSRRLGRSRDAAYRLAENNYEPLIETGADE